MSDLSTSLWAAFAAETGEHLTAIEPFLMGLANAPDSGEVAALFRAFHSLKGLAGAMGLRGMEELAHHSESLLGLVRDHGAQVDEAMLDALLEATDELRVMRGEAIAHHDDRSAPPDLLARLTAAIATADEATPGDTQQPRIAQADDVSLGADPEMIGIYCEMLQVELPRLPAILLATGADRADLIETLQQLSNGAGVLELDGLTEQLQRLEQAVATPEPPLQSEVKASIRGILLDLADRAELLGELFEADTGAAALRAALSGEDSPLSADVASAEVVSASAVLALADLANAMAADQPAVQALARVAAPVVERTRPAGEAASRLFALLTDLVARLASGALDNAPALAQAITAVSASDQLADAAEADRLTAMLQGAIGAPAEATRLRGPLADGLDPEQRQTVEAAIANGQRAFAVTLFLEDTPVVASKLLGWLPGVGSMPTNRSVFVGTDSWFEILLITPLTPEALCAGLLQQDPDQSCLRLLRELRADGDVQIALSPNGTPPAPTAQPAVIAMDGELRVSGKVVDRLMDTISDLRREIAVIGNQLEQSAVQNALVALAQTLPAASPILDLARASQRGLIEQVEGLRRRLQLLHATAIEIRIVPIDTAFSRLPRIVRALAREQGKDVELVLEGREVRVDKAVVDRISEPLMHMVRNAIDHGIEHPAEREAGGKSRRARLTLSATQVGGQVHVVVADDGRGLDAQRILTRAVERKLLTEDEASSWSTEAIHRLVFAPGFSTAAVVSETSGRGVGMDVVLTEVQRLGGEIGIDSVAGRGARFTMRLPLTAATQVAVLVRAGGQCLAIPERSVSLAAEVTRESLGQVDGKASFTLRGEDVPVVSLGSLLWPSDSPSPATDLARLIVVTHNERSVALEVEQVLRRQDLLLLRVHPALASCPGVAGASVLGDGEVALLLDIEQLIARVQAMTWQIVS